MITTKCLSGQQVTKSMRIFIFQITIDLVQPSCDEWLSSLKNQP
jgi:hypothetical protein